jgi:hypothetical protein
MMGSATCEASRRRGAHLPTLLRIDIGLLLGRVKQADALQGHMQARCVHHQEYRVQYPARRLAN